MIIIAPDDGTYSHSEAHEGKQSASMKMLKFQEWMVPERSGTRAQKLARKLMMGTSG